MRPRALRVDRCIQAGEKVDGPPRGEARGGLTAMNDASAKVR